MNSKTILNYIKNCLTYSNDLKELKVIIDNKLINNVGSKLKSKIKESDISIIRQYKGYEDNKKNEPTIPSIKYECKEDTKQNILHFDSSITVYNFIKYELKKIIILVNTYNIILNILYNTELKGVNLDSYVEVFNSYNEEFESYIKENNSTFPITCPVIYDTYAFYVDYYNDTNDTKIEKENIQEEIKKYQENIDNLMNKSIHNLLTIEEIKSLNYNGTCDCSDTKYSKTNEIFKYFNAENKKNQQIEQNEQNINEKKTITKLKNTVGKLFSGIGAGGKAVAGAVYQAGPLTFRAIGAIGSLIIGRGGKKSRKRKHNKLKKKRKSTRKKRRKSNKKHR